MNSFISVNQATKLWSLSGGLTIFLERTHESALLFQSLEATVTHLGGSIDPFQLHLLGCRTLGMNHQGLSQCQNTLLCPNAASLDHHEIVFDLTIMRKSTLWKKNKYKKLLSLWRNKNSIPTSTYHWSDTLVSDVCLGRSIVLYQLSAFFVDSSTNAIDLLVDLSSMVITFLSWSNENVTLLKAVREHKAWTLSSWTKGLSRKAALVLATCIFRRPGKGTHPTHFIIVANQNERNLQCTNLNEQQNKQHGQDAMLQCKPLCADPCGSFLAISWYAIWRWHLEKKGTIQDTST